MNDSPVGCQNREVTEPQRELSPQVTGGEKKAPLCKGGCRAERDWGIVPPLVRGGAERSEAVG